MQKKVDENDYMKNKRNISMQQQQKRVFGNRRET
jgi:hypothetical protein